jgi:hypothetical protein
MPKQPTTKVCVITIGGLLIMGGILLFLGIQLNVSSIAPAWTVLPMLLGIIVLITGINLKTDTSSTKRITSAVYSSREQSGLAKSAPPALADFPKTSRVVEAALPETRSNISLLKRNLLTKCLNNERQVARLIEFERRFIPTASEELLIERAIERWERDNR